MQNGEDLRVRRTRKLLQEALVELTIEKGFAEVTVRDITARAMVNRSTFYRHYLDKFDLLSQYIAALSELLLPEESERSCLDKPFLASRGLVHLLEQMQLNADFYRAVLGKKGDPAVCAESFRPYIEKQLRQLLPDNVGENNPTRPPLELSVTYVLHAGMGAILWWLESPQPCAPEQLADWLLQFSMGAISLSLELNGSVAAS